MTAVWLTALDGAVEIALHIAPRASRSRVVGAHGDRLKVQIAAPPVDGAANAELVRLLSDTLGVPKSDVTVARGATGKRKSVRVAGVTTDAVERSLA